MTTETNGTGRHLVVGTGQIGSAIAKILLCDARDKQELGNILAPSYDVIHICFPYFEGFVEAVLKYKKQYNASLVVIHSTVPLGTSRKCGAVHSPVRGIHPDLEQGIRTFTKFFGGSNARKASRPFADVGINVACATDPEDTEAMKLWDTTMYGFNIILEKKVYEWCKAHNVSFDFVYTYANLTYNQGYEALGHPEFKKYNLEHFQGKIGGHCIIPNCELLDSDIAKFILKENKKLVD